MANDCWETMLNDYVCESIEKHLDTKAFYTIYTADDQVTLEACGPWKTEEEAEKAMIEYDGEMIISGTYRELQNFLKHNNKTVVH